MAYSLQSLKVLCIDKNKHMHQIYWVLLSSLGIRKVRFALDGGEALEQMITNNFDLIFCDTFGTPIDGIEFVRFARSSTGSTSREVPIIMVSCASEMSNVIAARDAGATEFMVKPISATSIAHRIESVVERPRDFLSGGNFVGPNRRRRRTVNYDGKDKRASEL